MCKKASFLFLLLLFTVWAKTALAQVDSLTNLLNTVSGRERVSVLNQLATSLRESDQKRTIALSMEADSLAQATGDISGRSRALENIGWSYYRLGNWQKSFEYSSLAFEVATQAKDQRQAARLMNNMGALYYEQKNHPKSIEQFKKGYELATQINDLETQIRSLNNVALNFTQSGQQDSALYYAERSIKLNQDAGSPYLTSFAHRVIGDVYLASGNYDSAQSIYLRSLEMARVQGIKSFEAGILHRLGNAYLLDNKLSQAREVLEYSIVLCRENGYLDELASSHKYLAQVFEKQGDIIKAYSHLSEFQVLNDSLMNKTNRDRLALIQQIFEENLQQSELELLKAQNENQSLRLQASKRYLIFFSLGTVIILGLLVWMVSLNRKVGAKNKDLELQKIKIAETNEILAQQSAQLIEINETKNKLFSILGHDLRGPIGQIKSLVDLLIRGDLTQEEFLELIHVMQSDINSVNFTLNNILKWSMSQMDGFSISPVQIHLKPIVEESLALLSPLFKEKNLTVFNQIFDKQTIFADRDLVDVIIRNVLNNAMKFSNSGDAITIFSENDGDWAILCVLDQGIGMNSSQLEKLLSDSYTLTKSMPGTQKEKGSGLGLQLVKEFVKKSSGKIDVESTPKHGTKFCIKFPAKASTSGQNGR